MKNCGTCGYYRQSEQERVAMVVDKDDVSLFLAAPEMFDALRLADEVIDSLIIDNTDFYVEERAKIRAALEAAERGE